MKPWLAPLQAVLLALWAGSLWTVGWVPVVLFGQLQDVAAGNIATQLFGIAARIGMVCGVLLIGLHMKSEPRRDWVFWTLAAMLLLTVVGHFGIGAVMDSLREQAAPLSIRESPLRARFGMWHGISSTLYLVQGVMALVLVARGGRRS